jgi:5'(3')-deoxyribonucleotidase
MNSKKILYIDMDNVLVDFASGIALLSDETKRAYEGNLDDVPGLFSLMEPMPYAIESVKFLAEYFDVYILSTAPWKNTSACCTMLSKTAIGRLKPSNGRVLPKK